MDLQTLFLGEPEYDENRNVINRKLGVQNMIAWLAVGLVGYRFMCRGGKKQKGGALPSSWGFWYCVLGAVVSIVGAIYPGWCHSGGGGWVRLFFVAFSFLILPFVVVGLGFFCGIIFTELAVGEPSSQKQTANFRGTIFGAIVGFILTALGVVAVSQAD